MAFSQRHKPRFSAVNDNDILNDQRAIDRSIPNHHIEHCRAILQQTGARPISILCGRLQIGMAARHFTDAGSDGRGSAMSRRVANLLVETLQAAGVRNRYGIVEDTSTRARLASPLIVGDLCAQIIPLNRYGLTGLSSAVVGGLFVLAGAVRNALRAATRRTVRKDMLAQEARLECSHFYRLSRSVVPSPLLKGSSSLRSSR
jgi:hypothetical protein